VKQRLVIFSVSFAAILGATSAVYCFTQQASMNYYPAHRLFEQREYKKAIPFYEKCLKVNPQHSRAIKELAFAYQWDGQYEKSIRLFKQALRQDPRNVRTKKTLAETLAWEGHYGESISYYQELVDQAPDKNSLKGMAQAYLWNQQYDRAQKILEDLYEQNSSDMSTRMLLARVLQYSGKAEKAIPLYEKILKKQTQNTDASHGLAESYMATGQYDAAVEKYQKVLEARPEDTKARTEMADILSWRKNYAAAIAQYETILAQDPENEKVLRKMADAYEWKKEFVSAAELYERLLARQPESVDLYLALAENYTAQKRFEDALSLLQTGLVKTGSPALRLMNAEALFFSGRVLDAEASLRGLLKADVSNVKIKTLLADTLAAQKKFPEALSYYREVLRSKPDDFKALQKFADVLSWDKQYVEALEVYDRLIAANDDVNNAVQKARILGWMRRYKAALEAYRQIYAKHPLENVELEMEAKKVYWDRRPMAARNLYERLIEIDPGNSEALFDLSQLFSYQRIWTQAIETYNKLLTAYPAHFRAQEGLAKAKQMAFAPMVRSGYEFFESRSDGRENDIRKHTEFLRLEMPLSPSLRAGVQESLTQRSFVDFRNLFETESKIDLNYTPNMTFSTGAFFTVLSESAGISPLYLFGVNLSTRVMSAGQSFLSYERKRLENNSAVIRSRMFFDEFKERFEWSVNKRVVLGSDYGLSRYSDRNLQHHAGTDILYYLSLDPRRLAVKYRTDWQGFTQGASQYFSPASLWRGAFSIDWKHYLGRDEIFFGAKDFYYELEYEVGLDSLDIAAHRVTGKIGYDFTQQLGVEFKASYTNSSASVYEDKSASGSIRFYF